ncbi:MAG: TonB-dependent receptor [Candidatus Aminicenantes bacterium]|nr:TonB-dependent receptor [Candidatus Aminicenantes bacterium]
MIPSIRKLSLAFAFLALIFLLAGAESAAQTTLVTMEGLVKDEQGAPLPGATVTARNTETGYSKSAATKEDGRYVISGLQPGPYECEVAIPGFATEIRKGLVFAVGSRMSIDFVLRQTAIAEEVVITATAPMVETTKSEVSGVVDRIKIDSLPLLDRDFGALTLIKAGVAVEGGTVRSNAQPAGSEDMLTDGVSNEWVGTNTVHMAIPADAIQEFRVMTNQYEAEYGNASGMVRSTLTRSGTNDLRGRVAFFYRDEMFDNVNYFVNHDGYQGKELSKDEYEKADFKHYNWSGNIGGPIKKDKAHFFLAYEGLSHTSYSTITSPLVEQETVPVDDTGNQVMVKLSYQLSEKNLFSLRYGLNRPRTNNAIVGGLYTQTTAVNVKQITHDFQLNWTHYPSDSTMNELRVLYAYHSYGYHSAYDDDAYFIQRPSGYFGTPANYPQDITTKRYQLVENFTLFLGDHSLKFGVDASRIKLWGPLAQYVPGYYVFTTDAPFDPANFSTYPLVLLRAPKIAEIDSPYWEVGAFVQDSWRVTSRLTLNYGLRFNYYAIQFMDFDTFNIRHFNPRFGFAYDPIGDGKTSIRGGIGTYSQNPMLNLGLLIGIMDQLTVQQLIYPGYPDPNIPNPFLPPIPPMDVPLDKYRGDPNSVAPYTVQTTLGFQREVVTDLSLGFDLALTKGYNFSRIENDNPIIPNSGYSRPDPTKGNDYVFRMAGKSEYRGLYVTVSKRYSHGWSLDISYTFSDSKADVENEQTQQYSYDPDGWERMYGPTNLDARHRLAVMGILDLPFGFQLSGLAYYRSALPWTPRYPTDVNKDTLTNDMEPGKNRNSRRGFDSFFINVRLSKHFNIDRFRLQVFAEAYNLTNRANFGGIFYRIDTDDFGKPTSAGAPRQVQLGARFDF